MYASADNKTVTKLQIVYNERERDDGSKMTKIT